MRPVRVVSAVVAAGTLAGSLVLSLLWLLQADTYWFVLVTSYTPYAVPGYLVALVALLVLRSGLVAPLRAWITGAAVLAAAGLVLHLGLLAPAYLGEHPGGDADLTVLTLNVRRGGADAAAVVRQVRADRAQVVVLVEATPRFRDALRSEGLDETLPHVGGAPGPSSSGTMIFSAFPLTDPAAIPLGHGTYRVRVAAPTPFWLVAAHLSQPLNGQGKGWRADWDVLDRVLPGLDGAVVVAGDFNSTTDHRPVRKLLGKGFEDAARQANSGWAPTYPSGWGLIAIDHVLTRGPYDAVSTSTRRVPGTDHRALVARLAVPQTDRK